MIRMKKTCNFIKKNLRLSTVLLMGIVCFLILQASTIRKYILQTVPLVHKTVDSPVHLYIPALLDGDVNLPDVLYHSSRILNSTYNGLQYLNMSGLAVRCGTNGIQLCNAIRNMIKVFGKQQKFDNLKALYNLGILRGRMLAKTPRPVSCNGCFAYNFDTLISPTDVCTGQGKIDLLILITSSAKDVERRSALRDTWLQRSNTNNSNIRHLFLFGGGLKAEQTEIIENESKLYGDILQESYIDSYFNLSYKVLSGYRWSIKHCLRAKFVARSADDMYVNVPRIIKYGLDNMIYLQSVQFGQCYNGGSFRGNDYLFTRHYQSVKDFPANHFGPMCIGTTFVHAMAGIKGIVRVSADIPWFSLEDHWVGFAQKKAGISIRNVPGFNIQFYSDPNIKSVLHSRQDPKEACFFKKKPWMTLHRLLPKDIHNVYRLCLNNGTTA